MKLSLAILLALLIAAPAGGASYWVSPTGTDGATGLDSLTNAKSLSWVNTNAVAGDTILLKSGTYTSPVQPKNAGTPGSRITYIGDVTTPYSRVVTAITLDSSATLASRHTTVKGVGTTGDITLRSRYCSKSYDSLAYCRADGQLVVSGRGGGTVRWCTIGNGTNEDKVHLTNGVPDTSLHFVWLDSLKVEDNHFNLVNNLGGNTNFHVAWLRYFSMLRNRVDGVTTTNATQDAHNSTWYDVQYSTVNDNRFDGQSFARNTSPTTETVTYLFNARDNFVRNSFARDTFFEASGSLRRMKFSFDTDGNIKDGVRDFGDSNNTFTACFVKVRGPIYIQGKADNNVYQFNTLVSAEKIGLGNVFYSSLPDSNAQDSVVWRHNTFVSTQPTVIDKDSKLTHAVFAHNIVMSLTPRGTNCDGAHFGFGPKSSFLKCDSNLVWCSSPGDSASAVNTGHFFGGCSSSPVGMYGSNPAGPWGALYGYDLKSHWGDPEFTTDSSYVSFNPRPKPTGLAYSSNLWADGYVGSQALPADVTAPTVSVTAPSGGRLWNFGDYMTIEWTATDAVAVTGQTLEWGNGDNPTTWHTIVSGVAASVTSYVWTLPGMTSPFITLRVRAYDAAGNVGSGTVLFQFNAAPEPDTGPSQEGG